MNRDQYILMQLLVLDELGFIEFKEPEPEKSRAGTVAIWTNALKSLSDTEVKAGFEWAVENWTTAYNRKLSPGDIREFLSKHTALNHGQMFDEIMSNAYKAAYGEFNPKTNRVERYQFNPLVSAAIAQMGGLSVFLTMEEKDLGTFRAQFRDIVTAINEKNAQAAIIKPVLESRAAIDQADSKRERWIKRIKAAEPELDPDEVLISEAKDPHVLSAFADLRDQMMANSRAMSEANVQRSLEALAHMQAAVESADGV